LYCDWDQGGECKNKIPSIDKSGMCHQDKVINMTKSLADPSFVITGKEILYQTPAVLWIP